MAQKLLSLDEQDSLRLRTQSAHARAQLAQMAQAAARLRRVLAASPDIGARTGDDGSRTSVKQTSALSETPKAAKVRLQLLQASKRLRRVRAATTGIGAQAEKNCTTTSKQSTAFSAEIKSLQAAKVRLQLLQASKRLRRVRAATTGIGAQAEKNCTTTSKQSTAFSAEIKSLQAARRRAQLLQATARLRRVLAATANTEAQTEKNKYETGMEQVAASNARQPPLCNLSDEIKTLKDAMERLRIEAAASEAILARWEKRSEKEDQERLALKKKLQEAILKLRSPRVK